MWQFECGTRLFAGSGALDNLEKLNARRVFIVSDPFFSKNGTAQCVADRTGAGEIRIFDGVMPDPTVPLIAEGTVTVQEFKPDAIIVLGGGSAMDCAKALRHFGAPQAKLVAIPTTSGSGSEVTDFAILTHEGVKYPLISPKLRPTWAILEDSLVAKLPPNLIADGGFDVLAHSLEAAVGKHAGPLSDALAKDAFSTTFRQLRASFEGDLQARAAIHSASTMAGLAFTHAGLGLCHALSHSLGGRFHVPHGRLNAILLPAVVGFNAQSASWQYAQMARAADLSGASENMAVRSLKNGLCRLRRALELPETLAQAGIDLKELRQQEDAIVRAALRDPCCATNPVSVDESAVRQVLYEAAGHG